MIETAGHRVTRKSVRLPLFGAAIERARKQVTGQDGKPLTQVGLRDLLRPYVGNTASQSYVARIEQGLVADPSRELLEALSDIFGLDQRHLVALIVQDKYSISKEETFTLTNDTISLDSLAMWEAVTTKEELWVIATRFVDNHQDKFQDAIRHILALPDTSVTFFIPYFLLNSFEYFRRRILNQTRRSAAALLPVGLNPEQLAMMAASYVIANPGLRADPANTDSQRPQGYIILHNFQGEPEAAIRMSDNDIISRVVLLNEMRDNALRQYQESIAMLQLQE